MDWPQYRLRLTAGLISVGAWIVAAVVLSAAPLHNRHAWQLGLVGLTSSVTLAASEAVLYNIPFAGLISDPLLPVVAFAFAGLAMIPSPPSVLSWMRRALHLLYAVSALLGIALLLESLVLHPRGLHLPAIGGLPAGVYRHHFLGLDIIVTRTLVFSVLTLLFVTMYGAAFLSITLQESVTLLHPISNVLATCIAVGSVATSGRFVQKQVHSLVFGPSVFYAEKIADYTAGLASEPELPMLDRVFKEVMTLMEVQRALLWTTRGQGQLSISSLGMPGMPIPSQISDLETTLQRSSSSHHPIFIEFDWLELVIPLRHENETSGVIFIGSRPMDGYFNQLELSFLKQVSAAIAVTIENISLFEASRMMSRLLLFVKEEERVRLATLLHNGPLQSLTLVSSTLQRLKEGESDLPVRAAIAELRDDVLQVTAQLRTICTDLHSPAIDLGVELTVREATAKAQRLLPAPILLEVDVPVDLYVSGVGATAVYHVVTEALNNIQKHAHASCVRVSLSQPSPSVLRLIVEDDGTGFVIHHASLSDMLRSHHFGLVGMHEWTRLAQGSLSIQSTPGNGTVVDLTIPVLDQHSSGVDPSLSYIAERIVVCLM